MRTEPGRIRILILAAPLLLAGCVTDGAGEGLAQDNWGEANRQTMAAQIIDPAPHYDYAVPESSGAHAAAAIERYRTDKVKQPDKVRTTTSITGSGGGSGGN